MRRIKPRTDESVCLISVEISCEAWIVRAQPRLHSAIGRAGEYSRPLVEARNMHGKAWHKISYCVRWIVLMNFVKSVKVVGWLMEVHGISISRILVPY